MLFKRGLAEASPDRVLPAIPFDSGGKGEGDRSVAVAKRFCERHVRGPRSQSCRPEMVLWKKAIGRFSARVTIR